MRHSISPFAGTNVLPYLPSVKPRSSPPTKPFQNLATSDSSSTSEHEAESAPTSPSPLNYYYYQQYGANTASPQIDPESAGLSAGSLAQSPNGSLDEPGFRQGETAANSLKSTNSDSNSTEQSDHHPTTTIGPGSIVNLLM